MLPYHLQVLTIFCGVSAQKLNTPPVQCQGLVPRFSEAHYYYHDNETYQLRVTTTVHMQLDLNQRSCFQVDIDQSQNETGDIRVQSLFYSVQYLEYQLYYKTKHSYQFGLPEFQSFCKCDCPKADTFCTHAFGYKTCSKGEICVTKFYPYQNSDGCSEEGPASLCCEISVRPYDNRKFTAVNFAEPLPQALIAIDIYALVDKEWNLFRHYERQLLPYKGNHLHLNGYENVAEVNIFAQAQKSHFGLSTDDKYYFYEEEGSSTFALRDQPALNDIISYDVNKLGWLRFTRDSTWEVPHPLVTLQDVHRPMVKNCKDQTYVDDYAANAFVRVIRNSSGAINARPEFGSTVEEKLKDRIEKIEQLAEKQGGGVLVKLRRDSAPSLVLDVMLQQKMSVIAHLHASYMENFSATINLDKHSNRYLNVTLILAYGQFMIEIYEDRFSKEVDLSLSIATNLPFAMNYTEILPLPGFIRSSRLVCVYAQRQSQKRSCKHANFESEPVANFELKKTFIETEGSCPGCNREEPKSFWEYFNPRTWFNGIGSVSEGVALAIEVLFYFAIIMLAVILWRRLLWPLIHWGLCSGGMPAPKKVKPVLV